MARYGITPETMALWEKARADLALQMAAETFNAWLSHAWLLSIEASGGRIEATMGVAHARAVGWLQNRLAGVVGRTLARHLGVDAGQVDLRFEVLEEQKASPSGVT